VKFQPAQADEFSTGLDTACASLAAALKATATRRRKH
jgi:hypothetical protein